METTFNFPVPQIRHLPSPMPDAPLPSGCGTSARAGSNFQIPSLGPREKLARTAASQVF